MGKNLSDPCLGPWEIWILVAHSVLTIHPHLPPTPTSHMKHRGNVLNNQCGLLNTGHTNCRIYHILFILSFVNVYLCCFQTWDIMKNAAKNIFMFIQNLPTGFVLLSFTDTAFSTSWRFLATIHHLYWYHFSNSICSLCTCVTFWYILTTSYAFKNCICDPVVSNFWHYYYDLLKVQRIISCF